MESAPKVQLSVEADQALDQMREEINNGFDSGKVSKTEMLSWIVEHFQKTSFQKQKSQIRNDHFDDVVHLRAVIREIENAKKNKQEIHIDQLLAPMRSKR